MNIPGKLSLKVGSDALILIYIFPPNYARARVSVWDRHTSANTHSVHHRQKRALASLEPE